jgi:hypothetical protein
MLLSPQSTNDYILKTVVLQLAIFGGIVVVGLNGLSDWWKLPLFGLLIAQLVLTYRMLVRSSRNTSWLLIFLVQIAFGPKLQIGSETVYLVSMIYLIPLIVAAIPKHAAYEGEEHPI